SYSRPSSPHACDDLMLFRRCSRCSRSTRATCGCMFWVDGLGGCQFRSDAASVVEDDGSDEVLRVSQIDTAMPAPTARPSSIHGQRRLVAARGARRALLRFFVGWPFRLLMAGLHLRRAPVRPPDS